MTDQSDNSKYSPFQDAPKPIVELAQSLVDFVERAIGIRPDFSPETLPLVDHYAAEVRQQLKERPELLDLASQAAGAYFGEVLRRSLPGFWRVSTGNQHDWLVCGLHSFVAINPMGAGYDSIVGGQNHSGPSGSLRLAAEDRQQIVARLEALPFETSEDFYKLSTRYEILDIVHEGVRIQAESRGYNDIEYTEADYDTDLRPLGAIN